MKAALLDVNVLVALAWPNHVRHDAAHAWFSRHAGAIWATCPITQCGFIRVSSNPKITGGSVSPRDAHTVLCGMTAHKHHVFWPADLDYSLAENRCAALVVGHRQVTDAYLIDLAVRHKGRLVTLDKNAAMLVPEELKAARCVEVISAQ